MNDLEIAALDQMLGSGLTNHPLDNKKAVLALRVAYDPQKPLSEAIKDHSIVMDIILRKRANHRRWLTETQRQWQTHMRSVTPKSCINRYNRWGQRHDLNALIRADEESIAT